MSFLQWAELLSYVVTIVGLPFAIAVFLFEQRRQRQNDEGELHQRLSDEYAGFLKLVLEHSDLQMLRRDAASIPLTDEQHERKRVLFDFLVSLFERAYILVYEEKMSKQTQRLWQSWEDYMRVWCRREDFRAVLPELLEGEDEDFVRHIRKIAAIERSR